MRVQYRTAIAIWFAAVAVGFTPSMASDYVNSCRSADGAYQIEDDVLTRTGADASSGRQIDYETLSTTVLKRETGYCLSNKAPGQKFGYETKSTVLRIAFMDYGRRMETEVICEFASDGLPAAFTCDSQTVTSTAPAGKPAAPANSPSSTPIATNLWTHNGSLMRLIAKGETRTFIYEKPRTGMVKAGANKGSVVFEGTRHGEAYEGTAYVFASGCNPTGYAVSGTISNGERRITLHGQAAKIGSNCKPQGTKDDMLVFDLQGE